MKRKVFSVVFTIIIAMFLLTPVANAELTVSQWLHGIYVQGVRGSAGAWGTGAFNYVAGATMTSLLPTEGWLQAGLNGVNGESFGSGTGYKFIFQFYNDANNVIALGIIKDPGAAPWGGLTLMVEGLGNGQPVGGYWPQNHDGFDTDHYYTIFISWNATSITFRIDEHPALTYPINLSAGPSFSVMGCARMPGDAVDGVLELYDWSFLQTGGTNPSYTMWTADNAAGAITAIGTATHPFDN